MKKLAIITTHPIQYNAPFFANLSKSGVCKLKVFYTWGQSENQNVFDPGFGNSFKWDLPLLEGYDYEFLENISKKPGSNHFNGIINPTAISRLNEWNPDAILVYGWCFRTHLKIMRHYSGKVPIWFRGDSTLMDEPKGFSIKKMARRIALSYVFAHVDKAFYVGTENLKYYLAHGLKNNSLIYAPHAVDNTRFSSLDKLDISSIENWKNILGIKTEDIVFLFVGKFDQNKKPDLLIDVFVKLNSNKAHLVLAGDGNLKEVLAKKYGGFKNIHFLGFQNQAKMPVVYGLCDVFFLISKSETWGLSLNEAMASSRVVVASNTCGGALDLIENGWNGWVFKNCESDELSELMKNILNKDKKRLKELGLNSMIKIKKFSYEIFIDEIKKSFSKLS